MQSHFTKSLLLPTVFNLFRCNTFFYWTKNNFLLSPRSDAVRSKSKYGDKIFDVWQHNTSFVLSALSPRLRSDFHIKKSIWISIQLFKCQPPTMADTYWKSWRIFLWHEGWKRDFNVGMIASQTDGSSWKTSGGALSSGWKQLECGGQNRNNKVNSTLTCGKCVWRMFSNVNLFSVWN